jgi:hypothetical protein
LSPGSLSHAGIVRLAMTRKRPPASAVPTTAADAGSLAAVELAGLTERELDAESADWLRRLSAGNGLWRKEAGREFHAQLLRIALAEVNRRAATAPVTGPELTDIAHQAAGDAMVAILAKLASFRGESRFTGLLMAVAGE